jgi:hypothetical protein
MSHPVYCAIVATARHMRRVEDAARKEFDTCGVEIGNSGTYALEELAMTLRRPRWICGTDNVVGRRCCSEEGQMMGEVVGS